jgi:hypothetical protein
LPSFDDDVVGFNLVSPPGSLVQKPQDIPELPVHVPDHPAFPPSAVCVPIPAPLGQASKVSDAGVRPPLSDTRIVDRPGGLDCVPRRRVNQQRIPGPLAQALDVPEAGVGISLPDTQGGADTQGGDGPGRPGRVPRRRVSQRWVYEPRQAISALDTTNVVLPKRRSKPP